MEALGLIGIFISIILIIYLAVTGYNILFVAPIASIVVILTNGMDFFPSLIGTEKSYLTGLTGFVVNYFGVFLLGAILAKYMEKSGAAQAIAEKVISIAGSDKPYPVLVALFVISAILTYGGVSLFVLMFVVIPLARPLFEKLNIAWNLVSIPLMVGVSTFTMTMLPGTPAIQNVVPTNYLGTTLTAAPLLGLAGTVVSILFALWYMKYALNKSLALGETYGDFVKGEERLQEVDREFPSFFASILPIIVLIAINLVGSAIKIPNVILISLTAAIILSAFLYKNYIPNQKNILNEGAIGSITPIFLTSSAVAFGVVITMAPGFQSISNVILNMPGDPLVGLSAASTALAAITGSSSGGLGIVFEAFAQPYLEMGVNPDAMHRVSGIASSVLTVMPHSGVVLTLLSLAKLDHRNGYKYQFISVSAANAMALAVVLVLAILIY